MAKRKYIGVDTVLNEKPFSLISEFPNFEEIDVRERGSRFLFQVIGGIDDGVYYPSERTTEELDALLVETLGSNLDELSSDIHLPAWSFYSSAEH